jgi:hypothetical protein
MAAPKEVLALVERFDRNIEAYRSAHYNEAQVRQEFIDPFFKALGWDMDNERGCAEAYKEVIHEDAIKIGGARGLFLEANVPGNRSSVRSTPRTARSTNSSTSSTA